MKKFLVLIALLFSFLLMTSCHNNGEEITDDENVHSNLVKKNEFNKDTVNTNTLSAENVIENNTVELPNIVIDEKSTYEELMQCGKIAGMFYSEAAEKYFGYGANNNWKYDFDENLVSYRCYGLYTDETYTSFAPIDYTELKKVITNDLRLTEKGFEELNANSPNRYYDVNGFLCMTPGEGGQAGWDYSYIIDYEMETNTITYNCARVGRKERWGYDEDLICPFTFRLALENGVWKLDGCSYGEGFFYWFIGLENDIETYLANSEDWQENVINTEN